MKSSRLGIKAVVVAVLLVCALSAFGYKYFHGGASAVDKSKKTKNHSTAKAVPKKKTAKKNDSEKQRADYVRAATNAMGIDDTDKPMAPMRALNNPDKLLPEWFDLSKPALGSPSMYFYQYAREVDDLFTSRGNNGEFDKITDLNEAGRLIEGLDIEDIIDEQFQIIVKRYGMEDLVKENPAIKELLKLQILKKLLEYVATTAGDTQGLSAFFANSDPRLWENLFADNQPALETPDALDIETPPATAPEMTVRTPGSTDMPDGFAPRAGDAAPGDGTNPSDDEIKRKVQNLEGFPDKKKSGTENKPGDDVEFPEFPDEFSAPRDQ